MGCCPTKDEKAFPRGMKDARPSNRTCTDWGCLICFLIWTGLMVVIFLLGFMGPSDRGWVDWKPFVAPMIGQPYKMTHGVNSEGQICGISAQRTMLSGEVIAGVQDAPFLYWCGGPERMGRFPTRITNYKACVPACPTNSSQMLINCLEPAVHNFSAYVYPQYPTVQINGEAVPNQETLNLIVTQSVVQQPGYPTVAQFGKYCIPADAPDNNGIRDQVLYGEWGAYYRPMEMLGALKHSWLLLLISGILSAILGFIFLKALGHIAGPMLFGSMCLGCLLSFVAGLFFICAIFVDTDDLTNEYAKWNPIIQVFTGSQGKWLSIFVGIFLWITAGILACLACTSMKHIDEMIGLVAASMECIDKNIWSLQLLPFIQAAYFLALAVVLIFGLFWVASFGLLSWTDVGINDEVVKPTLEQRYKKHWLLHASFWLWFIGAWWILEMSIQLSHYIVAYSVASWYFVEGEMVPKGPGGAMQTVFNKVGGTHKSVRIGGVDANYGIRQGIQTNIEGKGNVLIIPVNKKGPGLGRNDQQLEEFRKDASPCLTPFYAVCTGLSYHLGTIARAAPLIAIFRPFRMFSQCISGFLARDDPMGGSGTQGGQSMCGLFAQLLDQCFGMWSKNGLTQMVLAGEGDFNGVAKDAFVFVVNCGGSVAYLHGAMFMYEFIATLCITMICGLVTDIFLAKWDIFSQPCGQTSGLWGYCVYVEEKNGTIIASMIIAFTVSFCYMSLWNQTADVLLYCTAWCRKMHHMLHEQDEHHDFLVHPSEANGFTGVGKFCPQTLRYLLPAYELSPEFEHGLHAHGVGQVGAIVAAMEHNVMSGAAPTNSVAMVSQGGMNLYSSIHG